MSGITGNKPKKPINCATCGLPIILGLGYRHNENFHTICASDNGLTITERKAAVSIAWRQLIIERRDDLSARMILNRIGTDLFSAATWESEAHHEAACKIWKAEIYIQDRAAYQEHVESGEAMQINDLGEIRWAYPGEAR